MAEKVVIRVESSGVDAVKRQLTELQSLVSELNNTTLSISSDNQNGVANAVKKVGDAAKQTTQNYSAMRNEIRAVRGETEKFVATMNDDGTIRTVEHLNDGLGNTEKIITRIGKNGVTMSKTITQDFKAQAKAVQEADTAYQNYKNEVQKGTLGAVWNDTLNTMNQNFISAEQYAKAFVEHGLTPLEKQMNTAAVQTGLLNQATGDLIDHQEVWRDGQLVRAVDTYRNAVGDVTKVTSELDGTMARVTKTVHTNSEAMKKQADAAENAAKRNSLLGDSLDRIVAKIIAWQVINAAVATVIRSFREALQTMREVDQELTNIQKVSNLTAQEIERIGDSAYETASKYGVSAQEYLKAVYQFQKAGLGDSSEQMAELATKTMLVGDTTADVASKFLIAVNAAWGLNGSISELSKVVDEADYINNNYATDLEKLSAGMPIVASTAANFGMSLEETMAALGTITAKTQETGTKAATALRALIMNIQGQIGVFTDETGESFEITQQDVENLSDALKIYGNDAVQAARQSGELIDPMEALRSLAQAYADELINDQELAQILMETGGKLRTNQLTTLVKDMASETSTYYDILSKLPQAAGTADSEISKMLESWNAKTEILRNTWTQFLSHLIDTKSVKSGIDAITGLIKLLDSAVGQATAKVGLLVAGFALLNKATKGALLSNLRLLVQYFMGVQSAELLAAQAAGTLSAALTTLQLIGLAAVIYGVLKALDAMNISYKEQKEILDKLNAEYEQQFGAGSEYEKLKGKVDDLTVSERERLVVLEGQKAALEGQVEAAQKLSAIKWLEENSRNSVSAGYIVNSVSPVYKPTYDSTGHFAGFDVETTPDGTILSYKKNLSELQAVVDAVSDSFFDLEAGTEYYTDALSKAIGPFADYYNGLVKARDAGADLNEDELEFIRIYENAADIVGRGTIALEEHAKAAENASNAISNMVDDLVTLQDELDGATAAIEAFNEATKVEKGDTFKDYAKIYEQFLEDWGNGLKGSNVVKNAIEAIFGADAILAAGGDWQALGEMLASDFWRGVFSDKGEDYGANFMNALADIMDANGDVIDSNGKVVASFEEADETLTLTGYDLEGLAKMLGTTPDVIMSLVDAWDIWSSSIIVSKDEMMQLANALGAVTTTGAVDATKFLEGLASDGEHSTANIIDLYNALQSIEGIEITNVPEDIAAVIEKAEEATKAAEGTEEQLDELGDVTATPKVELDTTLFDLAITTIKRTLDELSRTPTIIRLTTSSVDKQASGTASAPGGPTLVNEEGPEIIQEGGYARIAGDGKPTITDVEPGARIFNAEETRKILDGRSSFGRIKAAKFGTNSGAGGPRYNYQEIPDSAVLVVDAGLSADQLKDIVALRKQELSFLQESGAEQSAIEAKQREIQEALHAQAELLRQSEEYQNGDAKAVAEVVALSTEWWKIENNIIDAQEKIAKQLREEIADAIDDIGDALEKASDAMVAPLEDQLEALQDAHKAAEERLEEEEKIAAIQEKQIELEKARIALENAQRERTVRQYNSRTGQWEWVANAKNVESAQENLEKAQKALIDAQNDLAKYYADQAYETQKAVLEKQIKATKEAFKAFRDAIKNASDAVKDGEMEIDEAYDYISGEMKRIYDEYGVDLTDTLFDVVSGFDNVSGAIAELYIKILQMLSETDSANEKFKNDKGGSKKSEQFIGAMSNIYANARERGDADTMAAANRAANEERGVGSVITAVADVALISAQNSGKSIADYSADYMAARAAGDYSAMEVANRAANILRGNGNVVTAGTDINKVRTEGGYDYGGILTGLGGIKATEQDEMVLPPDTTRMLLAAERNGTFDALLQHLGIVTSVANGIAGFGGVVSNDRIGEQHNGDIISINGIELRNVTENTTLGELTRMAKNLALVKGS